MPSIVVVWRVRCVGVKMENSKNQSWFTKYGFHIILAALIPSWFTYCGATKISKANFIKSIVPDLLSSDIKKQSLAIYSVKIGIGKNEADDVEKIIGSDYGIKIKQAI